MRLLRWKVKYFRKVILFMCLVILLLLISIIQFLSNERESKTKAILKALHSRNVQDIIRPYEDTTIFRWNREAQVMTSKSHHILIMVTSLPENVERRNLIRNTWARPALSLNMDVIFFTGMPKNGQLNNLRTESHVFGDLIVDNFTESYYALTEKTLRMLKFFTLFTPNSRFLVKTDDDVFINLINLVIHLNSLQSVEQHDSVKDNKDYYLGGVIHKNRSPHTINALSKWFVPAELWTSDDSYPPYAEGNFYIISSLLVPRILNSSLTIPLFHLEDIYVTGLVAAQKEKIDLKEVPMVYSASALFPKLNYYFLTLYTSARDILAYHCDESVELIQLLQNAQL